MNGTQTVRSALVNAIRQSSLFNPDVQVSPACILWPDRDRQWEAIIPTLLGDLGYGPTEAGGRTMSMNFGPLNKSGGERRLNVAITRATTEVLVFSSFNSSMIDLSRTSALAVEHLKHYLEFAEKGPVALAEQSTAAYGVDQFDSDFEQAVAWALRDKGWKVQT